MKKQTLYSAIRKDFSLRLQSLAKVRLISSEGSQRCFGGFVSSRYSRLMHDLPSILATAIVASKANSLHNRI